MTNNTAAIRYARALLEVAVKERANPEEIRTAVDRVRQPPDRTPVARQGAAQSGGSGAAQGRRGRPILARVNSSPILAKLVGLLAERDRLILLPDLVAAYRDCLPITDTLCGRKSRPRQPLAPERAQEIQKSLARVTGRTVTLATRGTPPSWAAWSRASGSMVYDASGRISCRR